MTKAQLLAKHKAEIDQIVAQLPTAFTKDRARGGSIDYQGDYEQLMKRLHDLLDFTAHERNWLIDWLDDYRSDWRGYVVHYPAKFQVKAA